MKAINYFYIAFVLVWTPVQLYLLHFDAIGRSISILTVIMMFYSFLNKSYRKTIKDSCCIILGIWILYSLLNTILKGHNDPEMPTLWFIGKSLLAPYMVFTLAYQEFLRDKNTLLKLIIICLSIYAILGVFMGVSTGDEGRNLTALGNGLPITLYVFVFFLLARYKRNPVIWFIIILLLYYILGTGTRKAFLAAAFIIFFSIISLKELSTKRLIFASMLFICVYYIGSSMMSSSLFADRTAESMVTGEKANTTDIAILSFLGDRTYMYIEGWEIFLEHKITGVGLTNYAHYSKVGMFMHSEYMVHLVEGGLLSFILFISFLYYLVKPVFFRGMLKCKENFYCLGFPISCTIIYLTAWTYDFLVFFMAYAYIHSTFIINRKKLLSCESSSC